VRAFREQLRDLIRYPVELSRFYLHACSARLHGRKIAATDLRKTLRRIPQWTSGHLRLARSEYQTLEHSGAQAPDPRTIATIGISIRAVELLENCGENHQSKRALEAKLLSALLFHKQRNYQPALELFRTVLLPQNSVQLSRVHYYEALEYAAFAALALELELEALGYLKLIPAGERSAESAAIAERAVLLGRS
jgi:hypothetical protein